MSFFTNNEYWKLRSKHGRDKKYKDSGEFADKANEYFSWCIDNPLKEEIVHGKDSKIIKLNKMRPFTIEGLCNFMDISVQCFLNYEKRDGFIEITTRVRQIIYNQKFEGAAAGFLNTNIIARDLGLVEKQEHDMRGNININLIKGKNGRD
jgi:hypothetical protein